MNVNTKSLAAVASMSRGSTQSWSMALPVAILFTTSAALFIGDAAPARWIIAGLGIPLVYGLVNRLAKFAPHPHRLSAPDEPAAHGRQVVKRLLVILLILTLWDYGFTRFALRLVGPDLEANPIARHLLLASPAGLFCFKFGWVSVYIGIICRFYQTWLARLSLWTLVGALSVVMVYWGVWFASLLSYVPTEYWGYAVF
jgi:hypothetical protein